MVSKHQVKGHGEQAPQHPGPGLLRVRGVRDIFYWGNLMTFGTLTLKLAYSRAVHRRTARRSLKIRRKHVLERETSGSQFA